jgi:DNA-binding MarR family transcriptional regulator
MLSDLFTVFAPIHDAHGLSFAPDLTNHRDKVRVRKFQRESNHTHLNILVPCRGCLLMQVASRLPYAHIDKSAKRNAISVALATERNSAMNRSDLADLNSFVVLANHLSFRAASTQLGVTASALSHSMRQLEERHGVRLLHRTTRSVSLTDAGLRLLEQLRPAIDQISGALENLDQQRQRPVGRLRIHATHIAAATAIAPVWGRFASTYPEVQLEILVETRPIDIVASSSMRE